MSEYKDLNLDREAMEENIRNFLASHGYDLDGNIQNNGARKRVVFGAKGKDFSMVDLHLNGTGTTTVQWKIGKNQAVGEKLAAYLKATINPAEFQNVNLALKGITQDSFDAIIEILQEVKEIQVTILADEPNRKQVSLKSTVNQDALMLTHHRNTRLLQVQGKPLSCYRRVIFMLTDLLDLKGLEQVLCCKDDSSAEVVRKEMAEDYLRNFFPSSYIDLPDAVKKLLISGCCVKLASPALPDYCLLLYPDLRALEGVLKERMSRCGMSVGEADRGFGDFFDVRDGICTLKSEFNQAIGNVKKVDTFNKGYSFYRKHRHTLFHMEEFPEASRMVDTLEKAISLSKDAYSAIDGLYKY